MKKLQVKIVVGMAMIALSTGMFAQLGLPQVEEVYGGRIHAIDAVALDSVTTRVFISTESANSLFYADVDYSTGLPVFGRFYSVADADTNDGFGKQVRDVTADGSGWVFFRYNTNIYYTTTTPGSIQLLDNQALAVKAHDGHLFYLKEDAGDLKLYFGGIDPSSGVYSTAAGSPLTVAAGFGFPGPQQNLGIAVNPRNDSLYIFAGGAPPAVYVSSAGYDVLGGSTTFTTLDVSALGVSDDYRAFGLAPDGRLFVGGRTGVEPNHFKRIAYSDNHGATWDTLRTPFSGTDGPNIACAGDSLSYSVFFGSAMSDARGEGSGSWKSIGWMGQETHPNDGPVCSDPNHPDVIYMTTDQGIGASDSRGETIFEIDDGVEAVQINDFTMNAAKTIAWTASKSGIRQVVDYAGAAETWRIMFPMGDGSPYYSIAMDASDSTGNTAYAGNVRVYKTTNGGNSWDRIFDAQNPGWGFTFWSYISKIAVHPADPNLLLVGVNSPDSGVRGGVFYSTDGGGVWSQLNTDVYNTEVLDFEIVENGDGTSTIYVACEYVSDGTTSSYGVKWVEYDSGTGSLVFSNDMVGKTGTSITNFSANSLAVNAAGDVYAAGVKGSSGEPRVYVLRADSSYWDALAYASLPPSGRTPAVTIGEDPSGNEVPFIAVESTIYYFENNTSWQVGFAYPVGMDINVLFWDDLLVGTGTGLYGHFFDPQTGLDDGGEVRVPERFHLAQNYPNPFNPTTTIRYALPQSAQVSLTVYNIAGQKVATVLDKAQSAGDYTQSWQAGHLSSGVYFYRLEAFSPDRRHRYFSEVRKMILLK